MNWIINFFIGAKTKLLGIGLGLIGLISAFYVSFYKGKKSERNEQKANAYDEIIDDVVHNQRVHERVKKNEQEIRNSDKPRATVIKRLRRNGRIKITKD